MLNFIASAWTPDRSIKFFYLHTACKKHTILLCSLYQYRFSNQKHEKKSLDILLVWHFFSFDVYFFSISKFSFSVLFSHTVHLFCVLSIAPFESPTCDRTVLSSKSVERSWRVQSPVALADITIGNFPCFFFFFFFFFVVFETRLIMN